MKEPFIDGILNSTNFVCSAESNIYPTRKIDTSLSDRNLFADLYSAKFILPFLITVLFWHYAINYFHLMTYKPEKRNIIVSYFECKNIQKKTRIQQGICFLKWLYSKLFKNLKTDSHQNSIICKYSENNEIILTLCQAYIATLYKLFFVCCTCLDELENSIMDARESLNPEEKITIFYKAIKSKYDIVCLKSLNDFETLKQDLEAKLIHDSCYISFDDAVRPSSNVILYFLQLSYDEWHSKIQDNYEAIKLEMDKIYYARIKFMLQE